MRHTETNASLDACVYVILCAAVYGWAERIERSQMIYPKSVRYCLYLFASHRDKQVHVPCVLDWAKRKPHEKQVHRKSKHTPIER